MMAVSLRSPEKKEKKVAKVAKKKLKRENWRNITIKLIRVSGKYKENK